MSRATVVLFELAPSRVSGESRARLEPLYLWLRRLWEIAPGVSK